MSDLARELALDFSGKKLENLARIDGVHAATINRGIEPAQQRFTVGVGVVIDLPSRGRTWN